METSTQPLRPGIDHIGGRTAGSIGLGLLLVLALALPAAAPADAQQARPSVIATTEMLGWLVTELADEEADIVVLIEGVDPHAWEPSARDIEALYAADLVVANGLGLEEGLHEVLEQAEAEGVPLFEAADHIVLREGGTDVHEDEVEPGVGTEHEEGDEHAHVGGDPHFWLDPLAMREVARALMPALEAADVAVGARGDELVARLEDLDAEARAILEVVPAEQRKLVTGHESMGYFADRYGLEVVGAVIPGLSSQGEASARELADLIETIRREDVRAIFTELGTPERVAASVAAETGAIVVELPAEQLPTDGSYETFIRQIATLVAEGLTR